MNWAELVKWRVANYAAVIAAVMVIVRLVEAAIAAAKTPGATGVSLISVVKEFFKLG